jgi:hypothetical protein
MSKALTAVKQNHERDIRSVADRLIARAQSRHFPSYFGNFGFLNRILMLCVEAHPAQRRSRKKREFPLITAFMAIV